ncbi:PhzF family phenazine biosynthesis protein, partial [Vibrio cholerae]
MRCRPLRRALNCSQGWWIINIDIYDVFIGESAFGNPCGVLELNGWLSDS